MRREEIADQVLDVLVEEAVKTLGKDGNVESNHSQGARKGSKGKKTETGKETGKETETIKEKGGAIN